MKPDWWQDWSGEQCVIVASGPSAISAPLDEAYGKARFIAVNESYRLAPWADILYACDARWWAERGTGIEFDGLKIAGDRRAYQDGHCDGWLTVRRVDQLILDLPGTVGRIGGQSGAQALNLAIQFGCRHIILVGFDASIGNGRHWHADHANGLNNPSQLLANVWRRALDGIAGQLSAAGVTVINASAQSELTAYPKAGLMEAIGV